jgi:fatty acid desaturase
MSLIAARPHTQTITKMQACLPESLTKITPWRSFVALAMDWALIGASFAAYIYFPRPVVGVIAAILIARTQLALAVLMHEGAHGVLANNRSVNNFVGQAFTAAPLMLSMFAYRQGHIQHHRAPMTSDDPVAVIFGIGDYPVPKKELVWRLFKDLTSISYFLSMRDLLKGKHRKLMTKDKGTSKSKTTVFVLASIFVTNGILLGALAALGHPGLYFALWILPALTFLQVFARMRAITEHAGFPPCDDQTKNARSIVRPNWQTFLFGPHRIHYHIEHHQYVHAPFYHLQQIHNVMKLQGALPSDNLYRSYVRVLKDVTL